MKDPVFRKVFSRIQDAIPRDSRVLLAVSGGLDSTALLSLFHEAAALHPLVLGVAHCNHGWRAESDEEETLLRRKVEQYGYAWIAEKLKAEIPEKNKEAFYRAERYGFFKRAYTLFEAEYLVIAHQKNDNAETIIKKVFEGSSLFKIQGMKKKQTLFGMEIVKPLLDCTRQELEVYLAEKNLEYFIDPTNADPAYTRAKLRHTIIPFLEDVFGKSVVANITELGEEIGCVASEIAASCREHLPQDAAGKSGCISMVALEKMPPLAKTIFFQKTFPFLSKQERKTLREIVDRKKIGKSVRNIVLERTGLSWKTEDKLSRDC